MLETIMEYQFIQYAMLASVFASIVCGIVGVIIVEKRLVMMGGGIAHASYGGVGAGYLLGINPIIGAFFISICAALGIGYLKRHGNTRSDVVLGLFWSLGMAIGVVCISLMPGYPPDLSSYLFGNILTVSTLDLYLIASLSVCVLLVVCALFNYWKAYLFDDEFAVIVGLPVAFFEYLLLIVIAMSIVVLIRVVGIVLVLALFTAPPAIAALFLRRLESRMALAVVLGGLLCVSGLLLSYEMDIPSGALIVIISAVSYFLARKVSLRIRGR